MEITLKNAKNNISANVFDNLANPADAKSRTADWPVGW